MFTVVFEDRENDRHIEYKGVETISTETDEDGNAVLLISGVIAGIVTGMISGAVLNKVLD